MRHNGPAASPPRHNQRSVTTHLIDELILRSCQENLGDLEERILRRWRQDSPENERRYHELVAIWAMDLPQPQLNSGPSRPTADEIVVVAERRRRWASHFRRCLHLHRRTIGAAVGAAAVLTIWLGVGQFRDVGETASHFGAAEFATGTAETATITLTDGSLVRLAPNTRLRMPERPGARDVWLDGRAFFAVESDSTHPFTVHTPAGKALVLGTRFEIRADERDIRLAVIEGHVALSAGGKEVEVEADEVSQVHTGASPVVVKVENIRDYLEWPQGLLVFRSTPLEQVARELEREFGVPIEISDSGVARRKVTAWFTDEGLDEVLTAICRATNTQCALQGGRVLVAP